MSSMTTRTGGHGMPPKLKTITLVERITFDFSGNIAQNAICLADVDNDGEIELAVGNSDGDLLIFKGTNPRPWRSSGVKLGHITAMCSGDLFNMGLDVLVVISADGFLHLFDPKSMVGELRKPQSTPESKPASTSAENFQDDNCTPLSSASNSVPSTPSNSNESHRSVPHQEEDMLSEKSNDIGEGERGCNLVITPAYGQRIPANVKAAMIVDTNGDGFKELVVTLTDRVVRTYQWHHTGDIISMQTYKGHLMSRHKWEFASQIGSTSISRDNKNRPLLIISQPGGAFIQIRVPPRRHQLIDNFDDEEKDEEKDDSPLKVVRTFEPLVVSNLRNSYVSTEILGNFESTNENQDEENKPIPPFAIATLDGDLIFAQQDTLLWNIHLNQQLFCLHKMDIDEDGRDELVVSSWNGHTYIVSQDCRGTEFVFGESVLAFCCGKYTIDDETVKVFVYVTANGKIFVYYDIALPKDNDMSAFPEHLVLGNKLKVTPAVSKFLLNFPFKKLNTSSNS